MLGRYVRYVWTGLAGLALVIGASAVQSGVSNGAGGGTPPIRTVQVGRNPFGIAVDERTGHAFVPTLGTDGSISVSMIDTNTGMVLRTVRVGLFYLPVPGSSPVVAHHAGRVFVIGVARYVYNKQTQVGVYKQGQVVVLDVDSGAKIATINLPGLPEEIAVAERTGRVFILTSNEQGQDTQVSMLDARSGRLLTSSSGVLGKSFYYYHALAVDERRGHVFAVGEPCFTWDYSPCPGIFSAILDAHSGRVVARLPVGGSNVVIDEAIDRVLVSTGELGRGGWSDLLDATTGKVLYHSNLYANEMTLDTRTHQAFLPSTDPTSANDGTIDLLSISMRTGATGHDVIIGPGGLAPVVDSSLGLVFVLLSDNDVAVITSDLRRLLYSIPVGSEPGTQVLDLRHQRLLVVNALGHSVSIIELRALKRGAFPPKCAEVALRGQKIIC